MIDDKPAFYLNVFRDKSGDVSFGGAHLTLASARRDARRAPKSDKPIGCVRCVYVEEKERA